MAKSTRLTYAMYGLLAIVVFMFFMNTREYMTDTPQTMQVFVDSSKSKTDGKVIQVEYEFSGQDPANDEVTASIKTIEYWKGGQRLGQQNLYNTEAKLNSGGAGMAVFNVDPPSGVNVAGLEYIIITTYVSTKPKGTGGVDTKRSPDKRAKINASSSA